MSKLIQLDNAQAHYLNCIQCAQPFTDANVFTKDGWLETQISGMCESCFDGLFDEEGFGLSEEE